MSAALQLSAIWASSYPQSAWPEPSWPEAGNGWKKPPASAPAPDPVDDLDPAEEAESSGPLISFGFYRKHTESLLRRYLYASMQVGRAPSILGDPVSRGWVSSRPVRTFEDALIFVLDIEKCLARLPRRDQQMIARIVFQEYTHTETADMAGVCTRTVASWYHRALDRLSELLLDSNLLVIPD